MNKSYDKYIDKGIQELLRKKISFKKGNSLLVMPKRNLSRGITYTFEEGYIVLLPNSDIFYYNNEENNYYKKDIKYLIKRLGNKKVPALVISGAINTFGKLKMFYPYITHIKGIKDKNVYNAESKIEKI